MRLITESLGRCCHFPPSVPTPRLGRNSRPVSSVHDNGSARRQANGVPDRGGFALARRGLEIVREPSMTRVITAGCIGLLAASPLQWPARTIVATPCCWFRALFRRMLLSSPTGNHRSTPTHRAAVLGLIIVRLVLDRRELAKDRASKLVLVVFVLTFSDRNPRGGGIGAGLAALLFTAVPLA